MLQALTRIVQGQRGHGVIDRPLPPTVKNLSGLIGSAPTDLPSSGSVRSPLVNAKYQSATDSCLGFSAAQAYRISSLHKGIDCPDLSGLFPYKLGRASMGLEDTDSGMSFEAMLSAVERFGIASEAAWPFNLMKVNARPSGTALHDAYDRRGVRGYYQIDRSDLVGVRYAIHMGFTPVIAVQVDRMFQLDSGPTLIDLPTSDIIGLHAMPIEDYAADGTFGCLNHYDTTWRDNGRCRITEQYAAASIGFVVFDVGASP
jgi:hypothetical protein